MGLSIFEETFGSSRNRFGKVSRREATTDHLIAITSAVQAVVDTFRDPNTGDRYIVSLSGRSEAYTQPGAKRIVVSYKPIFDKGLKVSTACTVMTGLTLHEIGHTLYTFPNMPAIEAAFGKPSGNQWGRKEHDQLAYTMLNIGDDARLEARMAENLPLARDIFPTMRHWLALSTGMVGERFRWRGPSMKMADRVNFAGRSVLYPWTATWSSDTATRAERAWWVNWGAEYIALDDRDADGMVRLVKVALDRLRLPSEVGDEPEPEGPVCGPVGPTNEPPKGKGKGKGKDPFGDDFDKDKSDEDEDEDEGPGSDFDDDDEDEDEDDGDDVRDPWDEDVDGDEDEDEDEDEPKGGSKTDAPTSDDDDEAEDGDDITDGENKAKDWPDDFNAHDLSGDIDRLNRGDTDWRSQNEGALLQKELDIDASTERIPTGTWGTAKVEVMSIEKRMQVRSRY